tara:strand:- start:6984 stop:8081 length:1098 start_codon:yes stop_codon:yes gene_type:complete
MLTLTKDEVMQIYKKIDSLHRKLGSNIREFEGGAGLPMSYSDRLTEEINLLRNGCGLFDLKACWLIALNGEDAGIFLQGLVTSDVLKLKLGQIQSSLICDNKGKILHHIKIFRSQEKEWVVICDPGNGKSVSRILDNFHVREDLELRLLNNEEIFRLDLIGPQSIKIIKKMGCLLEKYQWNFKNSIVFSVQYNLGETFRIINFVHARVLQNFVEQIIKEDSADLISLKSFDEIRIIEGLPRIGVDYNIGNLPQEVCLGDHISYNKGCYIGQETHARMFHRGHSNRVLVWLNMPENLKTIAGEILFHNFKEIGKITSIGSFREDGVIKGIGMIKNEIANEEILLSINNGMELIKQKFLPFHIKKQI